MHEHDVIILEEPVHIDFPEALKEVMMRLRNTCNELESIAAVKQLTMKICEILFQQIRVLSSEEATDVVNTYLKKQKQLCIIILLLGDKQRQKVYLQTSDNAEFVQMSFRR